MDVGRPGKSGACWRDSTKGKGFAGRIAPTCLCPSIGKQKYRPQNRRLRSAFLFSIRLLRSSLVLTRLSRLLSHCSFSAQSWQCSIRCIRRSPRAKPVCAFPRRSRVALLRSLLACERLHNRDEIVHSRLKSIL